MKTNTWYIVTKASDDETFQVGDHIKLEGDGTISCIEAQGWVAAEDVPSAAVGMECEIDHDKINRRKAVLLAELAEMDDD